MTASEVRQNWFRVLDEVAAGEVVVLERKGQRVVLRCEEAEAQRPSRDIPDYRGVLRAPNVDLADAWTWSTSRAWR